MVVGDIYREHFSGKTFDCVEQYNAEVLALTNCVEDELHEEERYWHLNPKELCKRYNITIKEGA